MSDNSDIPMSIDPKVLYDHIIDQIRLARSDNTNRLSVITDMINGGDGENIFKVLVKYTENGLVELRMSSRSSEREGEKYASAQVDCYGAKATSDATLYCIADFMFQSKAKARGVTQDFKAKMRAAYEVWSATRSDKHFYYNHLENVQGYRDRVEFIMNMDMAGEGNDG